MAGTGHTSCPRGTKVKLAYRDGTVAYGVFEERTAKHVLLRLSDGQIRRMPSEGLRYVAKLKSGLPQETNDG